MKCMVLLTWHYSDSTLFINLCFARVRLACPSPRCGAVPEIVRLATYFWWQLACIPIHWAPRITAQSLQRPVFISSWVIGVIEHSADSRLFFVFIQMSGLSRWCFPLLLLVYGPRLDSHFIHRWQSSPEFLPFLTLSLTPPCLARLVCLLISTSVIPGLEIGLIFKALTLTVIPWRTNSNTPTALNPVSPWILTGSFSRKQACN